VLAAIVQFLGLVRWPFLVPYLARAAAEPDASGARREAVDVVFRPSTATSGSPSANTSGAG
jgi:hypothetical protein